VQYVPFDAPRREPLSFARVFRRRPMVGAHRLSLSYGIEGTPLPTMAEALNTIQPEARRARRE
jgi:hypothetical protein